MAYDPQAIEPRWQKVWEEEGTFVATEDRSRPKFYALDMFPYPSAKGLHVGHPAGYTVSDVVARYKRACGFNVLHPMGYDAFGLPAEQRAIDEGVPPDVSTAEAIVNFRRQLKRLGFSYDWTREISTADPAYYKWTQFIFTKLFEHNVAYQSDAFVNWCPGCLTVLANDEVIEGKCERKGHTVEKKKMRQWMLKITRYAEALLSGHDSLDWPEATKVRQREWIGRSEGARIDFPVANDGNGASLVVFTTRPDTLFGVTFMVLAPEHPLVDRITTPDRRTAVDAYRAWASARSDVDRQAAKEKTGVDTGARAIHPATKAEIPIWIADYVVHGYGTGAIMAVPGHDERDFAFARAMNLPIVEVISGGDVTQAAYTGEGLMTNSGEFDGTPTADGVAKKKLIVWLEKQGIGKGELVYKMRDWVFSRQRYWGEPIPILRRPEPDGRVVRALLADELPLCLPKVDSYRPLGTGHSPLHAARGWVELNDPGSGQRLVRETDTMPGSAGSSWYFLRYCDPKNDAEFCAKEKSDYWMPVDLYVGGAEHTVGHLLYARMWQRFLSELGLVRDAEPFLKLRHQGMILAFTYYDPEKRIVAESDVEERAGRFYKKGTSIELEARVEKMSKRKGNVVNPDDVIARAGADAMRVYLCFMGPVESDKPWQTQGLEGQLHWLRRAWRLFFTEGADNSGIETSRVSESAPSEKELRILHKAIKKVTDDIEAMSLNTAVSALHVAVRDLQQEGTTSRAILEPLVQLIAPFAPHFAEEVWLAALRHSGGISFVGWPKWDARYATDNVVVIGVQIMGKTRGEVELALDADEATALSAATQNPAIARHLEGKEITKVIYKAGRILNLIVR